MSKAEEIVRQYLAAMERRDLAAARALLAPGFHWCFPALGASTRWRRWWSGPKDGTALRARPTTATRPAATRSTATAPCTGELLDGSPYSGIRFIDRFTVRDGKLADQNVWNDMAEVLRR